MGVERGEKEKAEDTNVWSRRKMKGRRKEKGLGRTRRVTGGEECGKKKKKKRYIRSHTQEKNPEKNKHTDKPNTNSEQQ